MAIRLMCADNVERLWRFQSGHPGARGQSSRVPIPAHDVHLDMVHRRLAWSSLPTDGVDDFVHTRHPHHAGKDESIQVSYSCTVAAAQQSRTTTQS